MSLQQIANNYGEAYCVDGQSNVLEDPMHRVLQYLHLHEQATRHNALVQGAAGTSTMSRAL